MWDVATDWRIFSPADPSPAPAGAFWWYMQGNTLHVPTSYSLLPRYANHACTIPGLLEWTGTDLVAPPDGYIPEVGINATSITQFPCSTVTWPPHWVAVHPDVVPSCPNLAVIGWQSPAAMKIKIRGLAKDLDTNGGDGVNWYLDKNSTSLLSGSVFNNQQTFMKSTSVIAGDFIYLIVDPGSACDINYDTTGVQLRITG